MTDTIQLAKECGAFVLLSTDDAVLFYPYQLEAFRKRVEDEMKERCVSICSSAEDTGDSKGIERDVYSWNKAVKYCTNAIRSMK